MSTVLGIDSGGTKTLAALVDETGAVLELRTGPGFDPTHGKDSVDDLRRLFGALAPADLPRATTAGLPYYGEVARITAFEDQITTEFFGPLARACNDVEVAHLGAFAGDRGVLCLAGTGSMAWARGPNGMARAGGFGDLLGDEGSAFRIGQRALQLLSHEADGRRQPSSFGAALAAAIGIAPAALMEWTYGHINPRAGIAAVARQVSTLAASGDGQAEAVLSEAGAELADLAAAAARSAGLGAGAPLACAGSVFNDAIVRLQVVRRFGAEPIACRLPPVGGATLDAARRAGWTVDQAWISVLRDSLHQRGHA